MQMERSGHQVHYDIMKELLLHYKKSLKYISDLLVLYAQVHTFRSSGGGLLSVSEAHLKTKGDRGICSQGPETLERCAKGNQVESVISFKSHLKTYFYRRCIFPDVTRIITILFLKVLYE